MLRAYTDGSQHGKKGGWAWVCGDRKDSGHIPTNDAYDAELMAICECLEQAEGSVCIVTDHVGIADELRLLMADAHKPKKAEWIWKRIGYVKDKLEGVEWMKRMTTNEQKFADSLARQARESSARRG